MFCYKCGKENIDDARFCYRCGTRITIPEEIRSQNNIDETGRSFDVLSERREQGRSVNAIAIQNESTRPPGIVLVAIYMTLGGIASFYYGIQSMNVSGMYGVPSWVPILGISLTLSGGVYILSAYGLWIMQKWGLNLTILLNLISIPLSIALMVGFNDSKANHDNLVISGIVSIVLSIAILTYLASRRTMDLYRVESKESLAVSSNEGPECPKCSEVLSQGERTCPGCGYKLLQIACPKCDFPNTSDADSCVECGYEL